MATSGRATSNTYKSSTFYVNWQRSGVSTADNYSDINWQAGLSITGNDEWYNNAVKINSIVINGTTVYSGGTFSNIKRAGEHQLTSGSTRIYHNSDGNKSFNITITGWLYGNHNLSGGADFSLDTIPRYASITKFDLSAVNETQVKFTWEANEPCDTVQYSINNGNWTNGVYPTTTISSLGANVTYNIKIRVKRQDSQLWTEHGNKQVTTYDYPKPTSISNVTVGNKLTVNVYNPLGRTYKLELISNANNKVINTYNGAHNGSLAGFDDTNTINNFYASIPNATSGTCYAKITYGSSVKNSGNATYSLNLNNCKPTFSNFTYKDTNTKTTGITGNNQVLIKGYSTLQATISSANKMVANKSATAKNYVLAIDSINKSVNYSTNDLNVDIGKINNSGTKRLTVTAYDSRNNSTSAYKDITIYNYTKPIINISLARLNNFENQTTLKVNGKYDLLKINNVNKNTITAVKYRYRQTGGTWSNWVTLTTTLSNGNFTCSDVILSLDNSKSFDFEVNATDKLDATTTTGIVKVGQAVFFITSNKKYCYMTTDFKLSGNLNIDKQVVGSLGGMWVKGRNWATVKNTQAINDTFSVVASQKTKNGSWNIGNLGNNDDLLFSYDTDTDYRNNTNASKRVHLKPGGSDDTIATLQKIYPVGAIYMSTVSTNPNTVLGFGTWNQITGRFLYCNTNSKQTGGSQKLDISSLIHYASGNFGLESGSGSYADRQITGVYGRNGNDEQNYHPFNNISLPLPPYFTVYCWHRTA